ncbi:MGDG synthase family glycosyltransferase [Mycobacterium tuberculosis]|uniref:MGDG synthase family glycosyltransferase n=1 Tax=Mycobacterium tuberculosis TaxID=1773 RepID=UPI00272B68EB|nr:hypothetical protein [Mycobacterium tuberculosis]
MNSDTGGGHRSAVNAIDAAVKELIARDSRGYSFDLSSDTIVEKSHPINKKFVELYNYLLGHKQEWMKYYFWFIQTFKPNDSELGYLIVKRYLSKLFAESEPDVIVSVHPMTNQYVARVLQDLALRYRRWAQECRQRHRRGGERIDCARFPRILI